MPRSIRDEHNKASGRIRALALAALASYMSSCTPPADELSPDSLSRSSFTWNQAELEVGLAHWAEVFPTREIANGSRVNELPQGQPLADFSAGGPAEPALDKFIIEQKLAGLIVLEDGAIRLERYGLEHSRAGRWTSQSVAKSVTSTLVGAAVKDGYIASIDDMVADYIPDLRGSAYDSVSIRNLMMMTSGVRWNETYTDPNSDISNFYSRPVDAGVNATVSYMRHLPAESEPGSEWVYKTGETHLLGVLVSSATKQTLADYLSLKLWAPYGMEQSASWHIDRSDHELAGCCLQASLRDYARIGQFVLDGGRIDGAAIVPDGWFEEATRTQIETGRVGRQSGYGYQWWTNGDGTYQAVGIHGQLIYIDPSRRLVIAINSAWPEATNPERSRIQTEFIATINSAIDHSN